MQVRPLSEELAEIARVELNEDPKRIQDTLSYLKDWIRKEPHLNARTDDQWLVGFLRGCKWSLERCKEKLDLYYSLRSTAPELLCLHHRDPKVMHILKSGVALVLPRGTTSTAPRIAMARPGCYDPEKYTVMEIMAAIQVQQRIFIMEDDNFVVSGLVVIMDLKDTKLNHYTQITPVQMKKLITLNQEASPARLKAVHFLNVPPFFETFFNLAKSFLNEKNKNRLFVHSKNSTKFYNSVPKDVLPIEYGGKDYSIQDIIDHWEKKYEEFYEWLDADLQYGTEESKRLGLPKTSAMFGVEGSFRQLEFD